MKELYLIDGNSLLFRAYYATAFPGAPLLRTKDGLPTNAINAFANMINKILEFLPKGEGLVVAFDTGHKTFRHEQFKDYKAQRKEGPEELFVQMPYARQFLQSLNIKVSELDGYEGDDIVGTLAKLASDQNIKVSIFTSDRDFLQLVNDNISIHILKSGLKDIKVFHEQEVIDEYGIRPDQMIDYKALCGDASDNYKGVPGIGPKKAEQLLNTYNTFENIIENRQNIGGKLETILLENEDAGKMCKMLATIYLDVPLDFGLSECVYEGYDFDTASTFLKQLEMFNFINRINKKHLKSNEIVNDNQEGEIKKVTTLKDVKFGDEVTIIADRIKGNYHQTPPIGFALYVNDETYYINEANFRVDETIIKMLNNKKIKKNTIDLKAFYYYLLANKISLDGELFDLNLAHYLLDSSSSKSPDILFLNYDLQIINQYNKDNDDKEQNIAYVCEIANALSKVKPLLLKKLKDDDMLRLLNEIEIPLSLVLAEVELEGFPLDENTLRGFEEGYKAKIKETSEAIYELAGRSFNINSPKQVGEVLFDELGLKSNKKRSTGIDDLKYLVDDHPIVNLILEHRKYAKLLSTYVESLISHIQSDGKVHTIFNQTLTTTGRLSSQEPNMQNITIRDEEGRKIRQAFFYPNHEYKILSFDYSNVELRILASLSKCEPLIHSFQHGADIHTETAKRVFHTEDPTPLQRRQAKAVTFGIVYGISDWGLSDQLEIPVKESREIINEFYKAYPEIAVYLNKIAFEANQNGYVDTMFNRRRYLRDLYDSNYNVRESAKRAALNAPIQGSAADIIKIAMVEINAFLKSSQLKTKMVLQIHDELIFKVPSDEAEFVSAKIKQIMENSVKIESHLEVGGGLGNTWFDAK